MSYRKAAIENHLSNLRKFHGERDSEQKRKKTNAALDYLHTHFEEIKSQSVANLDRADYRYHLQEITVPANTRSYWLKDYAGKQVHIVYFAKNRNGAQTAFIRCKYAKDQKQSA